MTSDGPGDAPGLMTISQFNGLAEPEVQRALADCCASRGWLDALLAGRPYETIADLLAMSDTVLESLAAPELERAVGAHPRIGRPPAAGGVAAEWSRREQSGVAGATDRESEQLASQSHDYELRFGRVFLVSASGLGTGEVLAQLRRRLGNTAQDELAEVRRELGKIVRLRLERILR